MDVILKELTQGNWEDCIELKIHPEQENFVASNLYSIAESQFIEGCVPLAIYNDDILVGFIMYEPDLENQADKVYFITRLMIDSTYQGKGYARAAIQQVISRLKQSIGEVEYGEIILQLVVEN